MTVSCVATTQGALPPATLPLDSHHGADVFARLVNTICSDAFDGVHLSRDTTLPSTEVEDFNYDDVELDDNSDEDSDEDQA